MLDPAIRYWLGGKELQLLAKLPAAMVNAATKLNSEYIFGLTIQNLPGGLFSLELVPDSRRFRCVCNFRQQPMPTRNCGRDAAKHQHAAQSAYLAHSQQTMQVDHRFNEADVKAKFGSSDLRVFVVIWQHQGTYLRIAPLLYSAPWIPMQPSARFAESSTDELPRELLELGKKIAALPEEQFLDLRDSYAQVVECVKRRRRILNLVQEALAQLRLDIKYLMFDLEVTREERDALRAEQDDRQDEHGSSW